MLDLVQARAAATGAVPAAGSVCKLLYSEHARITASAALEVLGSRGVLHGDPVSAPWLDRFLFAPGLPLGGGPDAIQRNTTPDRGRALPPTPKPPPCPRPAERRGG